MLRFAGYINILIALGHLVGLIWADQLFEVTGIGKEMQELAAIHASLPYLLTLFVAVVFFVFGLYGLSADNKFRKLPFLKPAIFIIAGIYIFRGLGEMVADALQNTNSATETLYSMVALFVGLLFLFGGLRKWKKP
ncbi:MAG: hypothetical protein WCX31_16745 [Salinivirgaceae bacterium]|jgi:nitrate reductase gamma subunit